MGVTTELQAAGYDGRFYKPTGTVMDRPIDGQIMCRVTGYVADNHAWLETPKTLPWRSSRRGLAGKFVQMTVADANGRLWPFLLRESVGKEIDDYELVSVEGVWIRRGRYWRLLTTKAIATRSQRDVVVEEFSVPASPACSYCGKDIAATELWGFDGVWRVECHACGSARGKMKRDEFLKLCEEIARRGRETGTIDGEADA
jgi:hypothetical protein